MAAADPISVHDSTCVAIAVEHDTGLDVVVNRNGTDLTIAYLDHTEPCGRRYVVVSIDDLVAGDEVCVGEYAERYRPRCEDHDTGDIDIIEIEQTLRITVAADTGLLVADRPRRYRP